MDRLQPRSTLREQAVETIRAAITEGRLTATQRYSVDGLATELGVSRTPVREALLELESRGMVRFERNQGVRVSTLSSDELRELLDLRLLAEVPAAHRAAELATPDDLVDLGLRIAVMRTLRAEGHSRELLAADRAFHRQILEIAGSPRLVAHVEQLRDLMSLHGHYADEVRRELDEHLEDHAVIVDALSARDPAAAGAAAGEHVRHIARSILRHAGDDDGHLAWSATVGLRSGTEPENPPRAE